MPRVTFELKSKWVNEQAQIVPGRYPKAEPGDPDQIGWHVLSMEGEPLGQPTVNLWAEPQFPSPGCVFIKITDEFDGWLESLEAAGLVERTGRICSAGYVAEYAAECRVLKPELMEVA